MSPLWLMDYGSDANCVIHQCFHSMNILYGTRHTIPISMPLIYHFYMSQKNIQKFLCFQSLFVCFSFEIAPEKYGI